MNKPVRKEGTAQLPLYDIAKLVTLRAAEGNSGCQRPEGGGMEWLAVQQVYNFSYARWVSSRDLEVSSAVVCI